MEAGRLRERVAIEEETSVPNGQGGFRAGWSTVAGAARVPAEIIGLSGDEALQSGAERAIATYRVRMRKRTGLTAKNRLQWNGQTMAIETVLPDPREPKTMLLLICEIGQGS